MDELVPFEDSARFDVPQYEPEAYRDGGEGMIWWCDEHVWVPIYPEGSDVAEWVQMGELPDTPHPITGRSYKSMWDAQKRILRQALIMRDGRFVYNLIVFCWMRGEGKSIVAVLIQLWKFFCWTKQQIMLGANSKDQVKFVHYDIMSDIIIHSPKLYESVGRRNIQEKEIRLKDTKKAIVSRIRSISSFSGIVSNITGFTFSEIFDMKNPRFYTQLYGSIRNIPNAIGVIDSTVSDKSHILYKLYKNWSDRKTKKLFFSYRFSRIGTEVDFWNPNMDEPQLNDFRLSFPFGEFEKYFQNLWEAGVLRIFTDNAIEEIFFMGADGEALNHDKVQIVISEKNRFLGQKTDLEDKGIFDMGEELDSKALEQDKRLATVDSYIETDNMLGFVLIDDLLRLGERFNTDWAVLAGLDMADPYSVRSSARTILTAVAKGLVGSRDNPYEHIEGVTPSYIYLLLCLVNIENHSLESTKDLLEHLHSEYDGLDTFCMERWGMGDLSQWCEERDIEFEAVSPAYPRQKEMFKELYTLVDQGRFKSPTFFVPGYKEDNLLVEELRKFDHDSQKKWFGSPEKSNKGGIQDDSIYSVGWCVYGGRMITPDLFRSRGPGGFLFGMYGDAGGLLGKY